LTALFTKSYKNLLDFFAAISILQPNKTLNLKSPIITSTP
jgi:hypothetical protein